jgi:hypothetical protein
MSIDVKVKDGWGTGNSACVTERGQLVTAPLAYSEVFTVIAALNNVAFNFVSPLSKHRFVITDILLYANKGVGASDATVDVYEADSATETTISKSILSIEMLKQTSRDITGLNLIVSPGKWINIKTDDNTIFATIMGYYVTT